MNERRIVRDSSIPYYAQLAELIVAGIDEGRWRPGDLIPSEAELTTTYRISRTVIRNALDMLSNEGRVRRIKGKGTLVVAPKLWYGSPELAGPYDALNASYRLQTVVDNRLLVGSDELREKLTIGPSVPILHIVVLSERSDRPGIAATLSTFDVASDASPTLLQLAQDGKTPQFMLGGASVPVQLAAEFGLQLSNSPTTLSITRCTGSEAAALHVSKTAPVFGFEWVTYDMSGRLIVCGHSLSADNPRLRFVVRHNVAAAPRANRRG